MNLGCNTVVAREITAECPEVTEMSVVQLRTDCESAVLGIRFVWACVLGASKLECLSACHGAQRGSSPKARSLRSALIGSLVAQCSATPAIVAATPPCSATPFQTQISVRHLPGQGGERCDTKIFRGCSATPVLHLQNAVKSRKSAATRVARHV